MESNKLKPILRAVGTALIVFIAINLIYFLFEYFKQPANDEFAMKYKHGQFSLGDQPVGIELFSKRFWIGIVLMTLIFFGYYRNQAIRETKD